MAHDHLTEHLQDQINQREFQQARLLVEVASLINEKMHAKKVSGKQLAEMLGISKGRVSHYLSGQCNLTLRTVADVFTSLGCTFSPFAEPIEDSNAWEEIPVEMTFSTPGSKYRHVWGMKDGGDDGCSSSLAK